MTHHSRTRTTALIAALALTASSLVACSEESQAPAESSETPQQETTTSTSFAETSAVHSSAADETPGNDTKDVSAAAAPAGGQPSPFTLEDTRLESAGNPELKIEGVRAGSHEGYDRVVVELSGTGTPAVLAGYNPDPRQQASGYPLVPAGNAYFDLIIQGVPWTMGLSEEDLAKANPAGVAAGGIQEIADGGIFEADAQYVVGLDAKRPYNLYLLKNPTRVVVDFQK